MKRIISIFVLLLFMSLIIFVSLPISFAEDEGDNSQTQIPPQVSIPISPPIEGTPPVVNVEDLNPAPPSPLLPGQNPVTQEPIPPFQGQAVTPPTAGETPPEQVPLPIIPGTEQPPTEMQQPPSQPVTVSPGPWYTSFWFIASIIIAVVIIILIVFALTEGKMPEKGSKTKKKEKEKDKKKK